MPDRLRIVHAVRSDGFAGVERYIARLADQQHANGHQVTVIGGEPALMRSSLPAAGIRHVPAATVLDTASAIDRWRGADILHVHMTAAETAAVLAVRGWRTPAVCTRHFAQPRGSGLVERTFLRRIITARLAAQIAVSKVVAARIDGQSTIVYPGVENVDDVCGANRRERTVLIAHRLEPEKGTASGIAAFAASGLEAQGWRLVVAGEGSQRAALERESAELNLGRAVSFLGRRSDVSSIMLNAGIFLATCPFEHFGLSVLEAMAAGLPVVAVGAAGHLESIGLLPDAALFPSGDAAIAGRLLAALAEDPKRRDDYAERARQLQRQLFTMSAQAAGVEAVYRSVL